MAFMRHNNNGRRHNNNFNRNRNNNGGSSQQQGQRRVNRANHVFESNGPDGRIRGTAQQIVEKYATLARDASSSGDKVLSLNYWQHAEHYQRLLNEITEEQAAIEREREREQQRQQHAQQPDVNPNDVAEGMVAQDGAPQAREPREQRQPRRERSQDRQDRSERHQERQPHGDENELPSFLQVPITTAASKEAPAAVEAAAGPVVKNEEASEAAAPRPARAPRAPRRAAASGAADQASEE